MQTPADSAWRDRPWQWTADGQGACNDPVLKAALALSSNAVTGNMDFGGAKLKWNDSRIFISADEWKSDVTIRQNGKDVQTRLNGISFRSPEFQLNAQTLSLAPSFVSVEIGRLEIPAWKLILDGINGGRTDGSTGSQQFTVSSLRVGKTAIGSMNGK